MAASLKPYHDSLRAATASIAGCPAFTADGLRAKTIWIRERLEPGVAREGPDWLSADTVLSLHDFFLKLKLAPVSRADLEQSRIHKALALIVGRATRWPSRLIEQCEATLESWESVHGSLKKIRTPLYASGGRLHGVCEPEELDRHALLMQWMSDPELLVSPLRAMETGHLEFKPGDWWIDPLFAFRDGIIANPDDLGGISADRDGAYAILLTGYDEEHSSTSRSLTYRCRQRDWGKHMLARNHLPPKRPVRVLRSHTLHSSWSPAVGVRYEGLRVDSRSYSVTGYKVQLHGGSLQYIVDLERDEGQVPFYNVLKHPTYEEVEDYFEYKRLRNTHLKKLSSRSSDALTNLARRCSSRGSFPPHGDALEYPFNPRPALRRQTSNTMELPTPDRARLAADPNPSQSSSAVPAASDPSSIDVVLANNPVGMHKFRTAKKLFTFTLEKRRTNPGAGAHEDEVPQSFDGVFEQTTPMSPLYQLGTSMVYLGRIVLRRGDIGKAFRGDLHQIIQVLHTWQEEHYYDTEDDEAWRLCEFVSNALECVFAVVKTADLALSWNGVIV